VLHISIWGTWSFIWGAKPTNLPLVTRLLGILHRIFVIWNRLHLTDSCTIILHRAS